MKISGLRIYFQEQNICFHHLWDAEDECDLSLFCIRTALCRTTNECTYFTLASKIVLDLLVLFYI